MLFYRQSPDQPFSYNFFFLPIIPGDITFIVEFVVESMVWLNDFSNSGSLAYQQLSAKFQKAVGRKFLIEVFL